MTGTDIGLVGGIILLVLLVGIVWFGRNQRYRHVRVGFFLERERFNGRDEQQNHEDGEHTMSRDPHHHPPTPKGTNDE